jgi:hypothetical protein
MTDGKFPNIDRYVSELNKLDTNNHSLENFEEMPEFLLYLAVHADPKRFFPFPQKFRSSGQNQVQNNQLNNNEEKKLNNNEEKKFSDTFQSYTEQEYTHMKATLDTLSIKMLRSKESIKPLSLDQLNLFDYILDTPVRMSYHGQTIHPSITEFEFRYNPLKERVLDSQKKKRWYLFHGSPLGNWHSILRNGIKSMSGTTLATNGAALGNGVYLANDLSISYSYGNRNYNSKHVSCIAVVEILEDPSSYAKGNGVYVIPNDKILIPRYLYRVKDHPDYKSDKVLTYYKTLTEKRINPENSLKLLKRSVADLDEISGYAQIIEEKPPAYTLLLETSNAGNGMLLDLIMDNYPYQPPIIRLRYKLTPELKPTHKHFFTAEGIYLYDEFKNWSPMLSLDLLFKPLKNILRQYEMSHLEYSVNLECDITLL